MVLDIDREFMSDVESFWRSELVVISLAVCR